MLATGLAVSMAATDPLSVMQVVIILLCSGNPEIPTGDFIWDKMVDHNLPTFNLQQANAVAHHNTQDERACKQAWQSTEQGN